VKIYPNPSSGTITFDWGANTANVQLSVYSVNGQGLLYEKVKDQSRKVLDLTGFANGTYFIMIKDDVGHSGTIKVQLTK
jgi:hypothetical protein